MDIEHFAQTFHRSTAWATSCLERQQKLGIYTICKNSSLYPKGLLALPDAPEYIFARGNIKALGMPGIAVIGTRKTCDYVETVGVHASRYIARAGFSVISGLALGCDATGHRGCLSVGGVTVAIVATGLDTTYPRQHIDLQRQILANNGCLVSEYPVGFSVNVPQLIARDRLQSAMARGVFVVATGTCGGTWHAIRNAYSMKRPVAFFDYTSSRHGILPHTEGCKKLHKDGSYPIYTAESLDSFIELCRSSVQA